MQSMRVILGSVVWIFLGVVACGEDARVVVRSIEITQTMPTIAAGTRLQLTATATYTDFSNSDVTAMVEWSSSSTATATVNAAGELEGVAVGAATITAKLGRSFGTTSATVTAALLRSIQVTAIGAKLADRSQQAAHGNWHVQRPDDAGSH